MRVGGRGVRQGRSPIRCSSHLLTKYAFEYSSTSSGRSRSTALVKSRRMGWSSSGTLIVVAGSIAARSLGLSQLAARPYKARAVRVQVQRRKSFVRCFSPPAPQTLRACYNNHDHITAPTLYIHVLYKIST